MLNSQPSNDMLLAMNDVLTGVAHVYSLWSIGLYTNVITPQVGNVLSDLTQPTYTGYAIVACTPPAISQLPNGDYTIQWQPAVFQPTAAVSPAQTALGAFLQATVSSTAKLMQAQNLDNPKTFNGALDQLSLIWQTIVPNNLLYGGVAAQV